ncbi:hypothetical protein HDU67_007673 [Dinochytrium kinnereticum]|nr:hypothetical protein HDU67_007673 [Dinochytrium kinnereticum]
MKQIYDFNSQKTPEDAIQCLQRWFSMDDESERTGIVLDFYYYTLDFAKEQRFTPNKTSALFSIMKQTHERTISSPFVHMDKDFAFFKDLLLKHSIQRPPFSEKIFSLSELKAITDYALNTYFRHYVMYKYVFTKKVRLDFRVENAEMTPKTLSLENLAPIDNDGVLLDANGEPITSADPEADTSRTEGDPSPENKTTEDQPVASAQGMTSPPPPAVTSQTISPQPNGRPSNGVEPSLQSGEHTGEGEKTISSLVAAVASADAEHGAAISSGIASSAQERAMAELKNFVIATLSPKLDEMKTALMAKITSQEEVIASRIKKLEEDEKLLVGGGAQGADGKGGKNGKGGKKK